MIQKLLNCLIFCYFVIAPTKSQQFALENCQNQTGTYDYYKFYEIECGISNENELNVNIYVDDPKEFNILLASKNRYRNEDRDNYEIAIENGAPMITIGSELEKMSVQADASKGNVQNASADKSIGKITIQVQNEAIYVNILGKTYSYKLPHMAKVKYLSFAEFTGKKNVFYFNCRGECDTYSNTSPANDNVPDSSPSNGISSPEVSPNSISNEVTPPNDSLNDVPQEENTSSDGSSNSIDLPLDRNSEASSDTILQIENPTSDNVNNGNVEPAQRKSIWQRFWETILSWF